MYVSTAGPIPCTFPYDRKPQAASNTDLSVRIVHKDRKLDLVGWYTLMAADGPTPDILPTHIAMLDQNDACLLLGFHPDELAHHSVGAKLPLTIYESN